MGRPTAYRDLSPTARDRVRAAARTRYHRRKAEDPDRVKAESRRSSLAYNARHPERITSDPVRNRARVSAWQRANPERVRANHRRRYARLKPESAMSPILRRDPCSYCGGPGGHVDHIDAVVRGGPSIPANLTAACPRCNSSKGDKPLLLYLAERPSVSNTRGV